MTRARLAPARIVPEDVDVLELRALALAAPAGLHDAEEEAGRSRLVLFHLLGLPCALDATAVERAVARLTGATSIPTTAGADRAVAFVEEQPVPVVDLAGAAEGAARRAEELAGGPALVLSTPAGPVALAVEAPLDLREERLSGAVAEELESGVAGLRLAGRLADGTSVLDAGWLVEWAGKAARS